MNKPSILIIDDSEPVLAHAKEALTEAGYDVVTTTQTVGLGQHLSNCDLVLIDYFMPGFNGKWVLDSLKQIAKTNGNAPLFYLFTSNAAMSAHYTDLGFDGAFSHKSDLSYMVVQVRSALRLRDLRRLSAH
jgi:CheY-like chemotaxis protein